MPGQTVGIREGSSGLGASSGRARTSDRRRPRSRWARLLLPYGNTLCPRGFRRNALRFCAGPIGAIEGSSSRASTLPDFYPSGTSRRSRSSALSTSASGRTSDRCANRRGRTWSVPSPCASCPSWSRRSPRPCPPRTAARPPSGKRTGSSRRRPPRRVQVVLQLGGDECDLVVVLGLRGVGGQLLQPLGDYEARVGYGLHGRVGGVEDVEVAQE